jgi:hypothetical protein
MDSQPDIHASSQLSTQEMELGTPQIQVPRSRDVTPNATQHLEPDPEKLNSTQSLPASSITPPPSTQMSHAQIIARTPSPIGLLASPPPTTKEDQEALAIMAATSDIPTEEQIDNASMEDLRQMVSDLGLSVKEARTSAAHYNLQHSMLMIESSKANNALEVELEMMQRELDVLQEADLRRRGASSPRQRIEAAAHKDLINDLNKQINILNSEIQRQQVVVAQLQRSLENRNDRITSLEEQNERLRHRIRTNREHMNGIIESVRDRSPISAMNTPSRSYYNTPNRGPLSTPARRTERRDTNNMAFDVLLLADKVISQETATAPSTPKSGHARTKASGHVRGTHSLSSLPSTPTRRLTASTAHQNQPPTLHTPLHLSQILEPTPNTAPISTPHFQYSSQRTIMPTATATQETATSGSRRRRRASSESTISIPDHDMHLTDPRGGSANVAPVIAAANMSRVSRASASFDDNDTIPESSASQAATSMLRGTPTGHSSSGSHKKQPLSFSSATAAAGGAKQAKLTGRVSKPVSTVGSGPGSATAITKLLLPDPRLHPSSSAAGFPPQPVSPEKRRLVSGVPGAEIDRAAAEAAITAAVVQSPVGTQASPKKRKVDTAVGLGIGL